MKAQMSGSFPHYLQLRQYYYFLTAASLEVGTTAIRLLEKEWVETYLYLSPLVGRNQFIA